MNVFEAVKQSVTTRQAAEHYGIRVGRNGMCVCPFHDDKNPSMKVDRRFHCFGCQADGDVIDCPLCEKSLRNCTAPEAVKTDTETPEEKPKSNMGSLMILLVLALASGGAALYYFKFRKPKADTTGHDDLDEYDFGEDEDADEEEIGTLTETEEN